MNIINLTQNAGGSYTPIQTWDGAESPEGYAEVSCDTAEFYAYRGFVTLALTDDVVTGISGNKTALDAYLTEHPDVSSSAIQKITALKEQLASTDYKAIKFAEGWISAEDYAEIRAERQAIRDQINALEATL